MRNAAIPNKRPPNPDPIIAIFQLIPARICSAINTIIIISREIVDFSELFRAFSGYDRKTNSSRKATKV